MQFTNCRTRKPLFHNKYGYSIEVKQLSYLYDRETIVSLHEWVRVVQVDWSHSQLLSVKFRLEFKTLRVQSWNWAREWLYNRYMKVKLFPKRSRLKRIQNKVWKASITNESFLTLSFRTIKNNIRNIFRVLMFQQCLAYKHQRLRDSMSGRAKAWYWSPTKLKKTQPRFI